MRDVDLGDLAARLDGDARARLWRRALTGDALPDRLVTAAARDAAATGDTDLADAVASHAHTAGRAVGTLTAADARLRADADADTLADAVAHATGHAWNHRVAGLLADLPHHHDDPGTLADAVAAAVRAAAATPRPIDRLAIVSAGVGRAGHTAAPRPRTDAALCAAADTLAEIAARPVDCLHPDVDHRLRDYVALAALCAAPRAGDAVAALPAARARVLAAAGRELARALRHGDDVRWAPSTDTARLSHVTDTARGAHLIVDHLPAVVDELDVAVAADARTSGAEPLDADDVDRALLHDRRAATRLAAHPAATVAALCRLAYEPYHHLTDHPRLRRRLAHLAASDPDAAHTINSAAVADTTTLRGAQGLRVSAADGIVDADAAARAADRDPTGQTWRDLLHAVDGRDTVNPARAHTLAARAPLRVLTGLHEPRPAVAATLARQLAAAADDPDRAALLPQWDGPADTLDHTAAALNHPHPDSRGPDDASPNNDVDTGHDPDTDDVDESGGDGTHRAAPPVVSDPLTTLWRAVLAAAGPLDAAALHAAARYADASGDAQTAAAVAARDELPAALRAAAVADRRAAVRVAVLSRDDTTSDEIAALAAGETRVTVLTAVAAHAPAGHPAVTHAVRVATDRRSPTLLDALLRRRDLTTTDATALVHAAGDACPHTLHRRGLVTALLAHPHDHDLLHPDADTRAAAVLAALTRRPLPDHADLAAAVDTAATVVAARRRAPLPRTVAAAAALPGRLAAAVVAAAGPAAASRDHLARLAAAADPDVGDAHVLSRRHERDDDAVVRYLDAHARVAAAVDALPHPASADTVADAADSLRDVVDHYALGERLAVARPDAAAATLSGADTPRGVLDGVAAHADAATLTAAARTALTASADTAAALAAAVSAAGRADDLDRPTAAALTLRTAAIPARARAVHVGDLDPRLARAAAETLARHPA